SSCALLGCLSVRRAWQLGCKRFITNRGDIVSAGLRDDVISNGEETFATQLPSSANRQTTKAVLKFPSASPSHSRGPTQPCTDDVTSIDDETFAIQLPSSANRPTTKQRTRATYIPPQHRLYS
ncbi:hypothetical protein T265_13235, partial [Opisthorchis viverrini]